METTESLQRLNDRGWRMGLANLMDQENGKWWKTRQSVVRALTFTLLLCGLVAAALFGGHFINAPGGLERGLSLFAILEGIFPAIVITIIAMDALIGEKQSGTAAWVLSKPVSRVAVIVSKLTANALGALVTLVLVPSAFFYVIIAAITGQLLAPLPFMAGTAVMFVNVLFYLSLTIFLGTLLNKRGPVIGIPLILALGYQLVDGLAPWLATVLPWGLIFPTAQAPSLVVALFEGQAPVSWLPLACTLAWTTLFTGLAVRRYGRQEF
ncbi:MAG: ABC transporter permease [Spirochaetia bacterium]|jgi:ABC-2 type transport system permease protein